MKKYCGYCVTAEILEFIKGIEAYVETNFGFALVSSNENIYIEPISDSIEIYRNEKKVAEFPTVEKFLFNFEVDGKKIIEVLDSFDFA